MRSTHRYADQELSVREIGDGPVVVFIAGFGLDHRIWDGQVAVLAQTHRVICVDLLGTGQSAKPLHGYSPEEQADLVISTLEECGGADRFAIVGHSFGGMVAFNIAARFAHRVQTLILVGSNAVRAGRSAVFPFGPDGPRMLERLVSIERTNRIAGRRGVLAAGFATDPGDCVVNFLTDIFLDMPSWSAIECYQDMYGADQIDMIERVTVPVVQIVGDRDRVHPPAGAQWLQDRLPHTSLEVVRDAGHYLMFERPDMLNALLSRILDAP